MKMKKLLLTLGTVAAVAAPVAAVVACSSDESTTIYNSVNVSGLALKDGSHNPLVINSIGNKVILAKGGSMYLVPLKYIDVTPAVKKVVGDDGTVTTVPVAAKYALNDEGKKVPELHALGNIVATDFSDKVTKDNILIVEYKNKGNISDNKVTEVKQLTLGVTSTRSEFYKEMFDLAKTFVIKPTDVKTEDTSKNTYVTDESANAALKSFNEGVDHGKEITGVTGPVNIMEAIQDRNIETYFNSKKAK